jgi:syndecan 4
VCDRDDEYRKTHDSDKDSVLDFADNCPKISNTNQLDTDGDFIGDVCDNCMSLKNTDQTDTNKNTVGDSCEDVDNDTFI